MPTCYNTPLFVLQWVLEYKDSWNIWVSLLCHTLVWVSARLHQGSFESVKFSCFPAIIGTPHPSLRQSLSFLEFYTLSCHKNMLHETCCIKIKHVYTGPSLHLNIGNSIPPLGFQVRNTVIQPFPGYLCILNCLPVGLALLHLWTQLVITFAYNDKGFNYN